MGIYNVALLLGVAYNKAIIMITYHTYANIIPTDMTPKNAWGRLMFMKHMDEYIITYTTLSHTILIKHCLVLAKQE